MNRKSTMRSFTWEPQDGDEISACPDCCHCWHVLFHVDYDEDSMTSTVTVREWHEAECPIWKDPEADG